ncbi:MAG: hypothetical protein J6A33_00685 [Alphaproteobacteria bacterium]|nr:hypothetical protein [Alphaproteobacteria bacterium]
MVQTSIDFVLNYLSEIISGVIGGLIGSGITFHFTRQYYMRIQDKSQVQKNGMFSRSNTQIGEINVRK